MKNLERVRCEYTGGGIYVYSALYNREIWLELDFSNEGFNSLDVPPEEMEKYGYNYEAHTKQPSIPYPTWGEILQSIRESDYAWAYDDVARQLSFYGDRLSARIDEPTPVRKPDEHSVRMETVSSFVEIFEDFLDARGIEIPNDEKAQDPDASTIYGTDYGELADRIEELLIRIGALKEE